MNNTDTFIHHCKQEIVNYATEHGNPITEAEVYVVWQCKTIQNNKALLYAPALHRTYFEITYNGDKGELYMDVYHKVYKRTIVI